MMNRHEQRVQVATLRRGRAGPSPGCDCEHVGRFVGVGVCGDCGAEDSRQWALPTSAHVGDSREASWGPCGTCGTGEVAGSGVCREVIA